MILDIYRGIIRVTICKKKKKRKNNISYPQRIRNVSFLIAHFNETVIAVEEIFSVTYLESSRTSTMDFFFFFRNLLTAVNYFCKKAPSRSYSTGF